MKINFILLLIILFSLGIRLVSLGSNPRILNRDEAAIGYNAYLLEKTGTDEWSKRWPLTLESFGDYKLIGYPALVASLFHFFPASDFIVRLPSALFGTGVVYAVYIFTNRLRKEKNTALWTAFLTAVTPIFFFYSRIAFEANVALFFLIMYLYFLIRPFDKKSLLFDLLALITLIFAISTYNTPLLLLPFIVVIIPFIRGVKNWQSWVFVTIGSVIIGGVFFILFSSLTAQKQGITIFADPEVTLAYATYRAQFSGVLTTLIGNKYFYYSNIMFSNLLASFSPQFLVIKGGEHPWHSLPGWGHILWPLYLTSFVGIALSIKNLFSLRKIKNLKKLLELNLIQSQLGQSFLLLYLLIIALAPSVITVDSPHATRSLFFILVLVIFSGIGIERIIQPSRYRTACMLAIFISFGTLFATYLYTYFNKYPQEQTAILQTGFAETIHTVDEHYPTEPIAVVDESGYQYILLAWYLKISPQEFFSSVVKQNPDRIGFRYGEKVGRYHFIAHTLDRSQAEKYVVEWKENQWQVSE